MNSSTLIRIVHTIKYITAALVLTGTSWMVHGDVKSDFELGSGGMKVVAIEGMMTNTIYVLMCIFGGWVMVHTIRKLITEDGTTWYDNIGLVLRAMLILIVMILTLT